jgi:catechol 2,3-dioxygenase-like lactoylglutathione lyase family enzyme
MFDHVTIRVTDRLSSERFYDTVLTPLRIDRIYLEVVNHHLS